MAVILHPEPMAFSRNTFCKTAIMPGMSRNNLDQLPLFKVLKRILVELGTAGLVIVHQGYVLFRFLTNQARSWKRIIKMQPVSNILFHDSCMFMGFVRFGGE